MPSKVISYPNAVFGYAADEPVLYGDVVGYYVASAAIVANKLVILDTTNLRQVLTATATVDGHLIIGVANEAAAAGEVVAVTLTGFTTAASNTAITSGDRVGPDATTAGNVASVTAATAVTQAKDVGNVVGIAAETVTAGVTSVRVFIQKL